MNAQCYACGWEIIENDDEDEDVKAYKNGEVCKQCEDDGFAR